MANLDLFSAGAGAGFDEGWAEGGIDAELGVTGGLHAQFCHGIDLGVDIGASAEANAMLRLLVVGARANAGVQAQAGVRGRLTLEPNVFDSFGLVGRIEAAAEVAARARLEVGLEAEYVAELAAQQLDGIALQLFLGFLKEIRVSGGVYGKIAFSAMAKAWLRASGQLGDGDDSGFVIGGGYSVGLKAGYGMDWYVTIGFDNPRRFFSTAVHLITDEIVKELHDTLPPGSEIGVEAFRLLIPAGLSAAYDVGQRSLSQGITTPEQIVEPFLVAFAEELQNFLVAKATDLAAAMVSALIEEAIVRGDLASVGSADKAAIEAAVTRLIEVLADGKIDPDDVDEVLALGFLVAEHGAPDLMDRFRRPAALLWTAAAVAVALREVGDLVAGAEVSLLGVGAAAPARIREMPPLTSMPSTVVEEYLAAVDDFDGTSLTFDHAMDYLVEAGIGPMLADQAPELSALLDQLHRATGVSPGNIVTFGIQGAIGGAVSETELYAELRDFFRSCVEELLEGYVFSAFDEVSAGNEDARLYMDEVARPSVDLILSFVFSQLDAAVRDPSVLSAVEYMTSLQAGIGALLYKIAARNIVVLEQIASDTVREQAVDALAVLEDYVRSDASSTLVQASLDHVDEVLDGLGAVLPLPIGGTGITEEQLLALQEFIGELLSIAQESFGTDVFTNARWNRRREATLALLLSLDASVEWGSEDLLAEAIQTLKSCAFVPDEQALWDLFRVNLDILASQALILLRRLPGPLATLLTTLTAPQLAQLQQLASAAEASAERLLAAAQEALAQLRQLISQAFSMATAAATELAAAIQTGVAALATLSTQVLRNQFITLGQHNIRAAGAALGLSDSVIDPLADGFSLVVDAGLALLTPLVDIAIAAVRTTSVISEAVAAAIGGISATEYLSAGSGGAFTAQAMEAFTDALNAKIRDSLIPNPLDPNPALTLTVPLPNGDTVGLRPSDILDIVTDAVVAGLSYPAIIRPALSQGYFQALEAGHRAAEPSKVSQRDNAQNELTAVKARPGTTVEVFNPSPLDTRAGHYFMYGPLVPVEAQVRKAGSAWARNDDTRRIQVAVNGSVIDLPADAWTYDAAAGGSLTLRTTLRLDQGPIVAGLNVLEISVANDLGDPARRTVEFLVDPEGPLVDTALVIDPDASQFNPPGSDHTNAFEEFVTIRHEGPGTVNLSGWVLRDKAGHRYKFGDVSLRTGRSIRVRTGGQPSDDTETDVHWGRRSAVWNNRGDTLTLVDDRKVVRAHYVYSGGR